MHSILPTATRCGMPAISAVTNSPTAWRPSRRSFVPCAAMWTGQASGDGSEMEIFEVEGVKVVMTHIGGYPGKYAPGIKSRLELSRPKLFVCGHSHILKVMPDRSLGCLVVNPGAAGVQGWQVVRTLVTLTLDHGNITHAQVIELAK